MKRLDDREVLICIALLLQHLRDMKSNQLLTMNWGIIIPLWCVLLLWQSIHMKMQLNHWFSSNKISGPQIILMTIFIVENEIRNPHIKTWGFGRDNYWIVNNSLQNKWTKWNPNRRLIRSITITHKWDIQILLGISQTIFTKKTVWISH